MKKIILFMVLVFGVVSNSLASDCNMLANTQIRINQIYNPNGNNNGYIELYVMNGSVDISEWELCSAPNKSQSSCVDMGIGEGDVYFYGTNEGKDNILNPIATDRFIIYNENLFSKGIGQSSGEVMIKDSNDNVVHYVKYYINDNGQWAYSADSECTTDVHQDNSSNIGTCATPDGIEDGTDWDTTCGDTKGTYNTDISDYLDTKIISNWIMDSCLWNGSENEVKDSKSSNDGTSKTANTQPPLTVATTSSDGQINRAGEFKGEGYNADPDNTWYEADYFIDVADSDSLSPLSVSAFKQMSITGWFNINSLGLTQTILHKGESNDNREYRVFIDGDNKLKFTVWNFWGSPQTITLEHALESNKYYFFTASAITDTGILPLVSDDLKLKLILKEDENSYFKESYINSFTYRLLNSGNLQFGATMWRNDNITNYFNGKLDEIKLYNKELEASEINRIFHYENQHKNWDGSDRAEVNCIGGTIPCTSLQYNIYSPLSIDNKLYTQIVGQPFDVNITIACLAGEEITPFTVTNIYAIDSTSSCSLASEKENLWSGTSQELNSTNLTITLPNELNSSKAFKSVKLMIETNSSDINCSDDNLSIRPATFSWSPDFDSPKIKAGESGKVLSVNINDINTTDGNNSYNGTATLTAGSQAQIIDYTILACETNQTSFSVDINTTNIAFSDGNNSQKFDINISDITDVGVYELNITLIDSTWTKVDQPNDCLQVGCNIETNTSLELTVYPYKLNIVLPNSISSNYGASGEQFVYYGQGVTTKDKYLSLPYTIQTVNEDNCVTKNYSENCFNPSNALADINVTLNAKNINDDFIIYYWGDKDGHKNLNSGKAEIKDINISKDRFTNGEAIGDLKFVFDIQLQNPTTGSNKIPKNPIKFVGGDTNETNVSFDINSSLEINSTLDNDIGDIKGEIEDINLTTPSDTNTTYYFARLVPIDVKTTDNSSATVSFYIDVYCDLVNCGNYNLSEKSKVYPSNWYVNTNDDNAPTITFSPSGTKTLNGNDGNFTATFTKAELGLGTGFGRVRIDIDHNSTDNNNTYLYYNPYSDANITRFYIDFLASPDSNSSDVVENQGAGTSGGKRLDW